MVSKDQVNRLQRFRFIKATAKFRGRAVENHAHSDWYIYCQGGKGPASQKSPHPNKSLRCVRAHLRLCFSWCCSRSRKCSFLFFLGRRSLPPFGEPLPLFIFRYIRSPSHLCYEINQQGGGDGDPSFQPRQKQHHEPQQNRGAGSGAGAASTAPAGPFSRELRLRTSVGSGSGGDDTALLAQRRGAGAGAGAGGGGGGGRVAAARTVNAVGRPPLPHGGNGTIIANKNFHHREGKMGTTDHGRTTFSPGLGLEGEWDGGGDGDDAGGGGDDVSLAGLSLASGNSMQYSVDSG